MNKIRVLVFVTSFMAISALTAPAALAKPKVPKVPNVSPDINFPGNSKVIKLLDIGLGIAVVALIGLFIWGLVMIVAGLAGKGNHAIRGFVMAIAAAIVIGILFSFSPFLQSWVGAVS